MKLRDRLHFPTSGSEHDALNGKGKQIDTSLLPIDPATGEPIPPRASVGYYPGFSTLSQAPFWDEATRKVVMHRVEHVPPIQFFTSDEARVMQAVVDRILPQDDRDADRKVAILNYIDHRLHNNVTDGYRFEKMPSDREAHKLGVQVIEVIANHLYGKSFPDLDQREQDTVLLTIHDGNPPAGEDIWQRMSVKHFWMLLVQDCVAAYYAHPYAWDEIGFGGPAYPRGYMRLENGKPEPWEVDEQRYEWTAPPDALSGNYTNLDRESPMEQQFQTPGQGGTH